MFKQIINKPVMLMALGIVFSGSMATQVLADEGKAIADEKCASCHGKDGVSTHSEVPTIAGMSQLYLSDSMFIYKDENRPCIEHEYPEGPDKGKKASMCAIADDLDDDEIKAVTQYYSQLKYVPAKQKFDAALAAKGKDVHDDMCEKCHSEGGSLASDDAGILAGQWMPYLEGQLKAHIAGKREQPKKMKAKIKKLDEESTKQLIHYYGSQQ